MNKSLNQNKFLLTRGRFQAPVLHGGYAFVAVPHPRSLILLMSIDALQKRSPSSLAGRV